MVRDRQPSRLGLFIILFILSFKLTNLQYKK